VGVASRGFDFIVACPIKQLAGPLFDEGVTEGVADLARARRRAGMTSDQG
jgi:hypothetical protein